MRRRPELLAVLLVAAWGLLSGWRSWRRALVTHQEDLQSVEHMRQRMLEMDPHFDLATWPTQQLPTPTLTDYLWGGYADGLLLLAVALLGVVLVRAGCRRSGVLVAVALTVVPVLASDVLVEGVMSDEWVFDTWWVYPEAALQALLVAAPALLALREPRQHTPAGDHQAAALLAGVTFAVLVLNAHDVAVDPTVISNSLTPAILVYAVAVILSRATRRRRAVVALSVAGAGLAPLVTFQAWALMVPYASELPQLSDVVDPLELLISMAITVAAPAVVLAALRAIRWLGRRSRTLRTRHRVADPSSL